MGLTRPLTRSLTRPLTRSLSRFAVVLDPDAELLIDDLRTAGATVSASQETIISDFIATEKAASRWDSLKRVYLPIWGVAAANAICWKTRTSGTFTATGVTHGAGFVQGNGSTGYFDFGISPSGIGVTVASGLVGSLIYTADSATAIASIIGGRDAGDSGDFILYQNNATSYNAIVGRKPEDPIATLGGLPARNGIFIGNRNGSGLVAHRRSSSGTTKGGAITLQATSAISTRNIYGLAANSDGTASFFHDGKIGALFAGAGLTTDASVDELSLNFKNTWEGLTGLALP